MNSRVVDTEEARGAAGSAKPKAHVVIRGHQGEGREAIGRRDTAVKVKVAEAAGEATAIGTGSGSRLRSRARGPGEGRAVLSKGNVAQAKGEKRSEAHDA